ncbi:MAG: hypothetical protein FWB86_07360 [Treponema sp.]|nr:hypothetical protein [Treponema sp.]MCL2252110.1 hypothetical protein [Treponema sp.]
MEKFKKILKIIYKVYSIFCVILVSLLIIASLVIIINFNKITSYAIEQVVDNYNEGINEMIAGYFESSVTDNSIEFVSFKTVPGGGLQASFNIDKNAIAGVDIANYKDKTNEELITELGITANDIPSEIKSLLLMTKQTLVLDFNDFSGNNVINRVIKPEDIKTLLGR